MICRSACPQLKTPTPKILPILDLSKNWTSRVLSMDFIERPRMVEIGSRMEDRGLRIAFGIRFTVAVIALLMFAWPIGAADRLRIGYSGATISNAMLWVTEEGKLFQKNGIDPEILYLQTTLGQTAMIAGEIHMCVYSASLLAPARLQGADVVMVA